MAHFHTVLNAPYPYSGTVRVASLRQIGDRIIFQGQTLDAIP